MTDGAPANARASEQAKVVREERLTGLPPRYEVPGWRERFGLVAGITGRGEGGAGGFDLGLGTREPVGEVMARWREFRQAEPGFAGHVIAHQVHGVELARHHDPRGWVLLEGLDGHLTDRAGVQLLVTVADCIPVYLAAPRVGAIALLHAGWRGTAEGILGQGVTQLEQSFGARASDIVMHCGIGICGECYEVGSEVLLACGISPEGSRPWHLDLRRCLAGQAAQIGLGEVTVSAWCSAHDRDRFYSHRASGGCDGRMAAYLGYPRLH